MSINPDRNNISGSRRSRSNEGNGHDEGRDVETRNIRPRRQPIQYEQPFGRQHSYTSEMIEEIANEHGIDPEIAAIMSVGEHSTLSSGSDESRRQVIQQATQRYQNEHVEEGVRHNMEYVHSGGRPIQARPLNEDEIHFWRQHIPLRNDRSRFYPFEANGRSNSNVEDHCSICLEDIDPLLGNHVKAPCGH